MSSSEPQEHAQNSDVDRPNDLAELYPANSQYWIGMETVLVEAAVLLSLDIEPKTIKELDDQHKLNSDSDEDELIEPLDYGLQQNEYDRRVATVVNALETGTLNYAHNNIQRSQNSIKLVDFVVWAKTKNWQLPTWLESLLPQNPTPIRQVTSSIREQKKAQTVARHQRWQDRADELHREHPDWNKRRIAHKISVELQNESSPPQDNTIRNIIKFNS